jgi:hypothetical protein
MAKGASQAALRCHYEDLIDETEHDIAEKLNSAVSWFKQVIYSDKVSSLFAPPPLVQWQ